MSPRPKSRTKRRTRNTPRSPQTILAQARRNNLERALERGDMRAALTGLNSEEGNEGTGPRTSKVSKGRRRARKYSKFVALPASHEPLEEVCYPARWVGLNVLHILSVRTAWNDNLYQLDTSSCLKEMSISPVTVEARPKRPSKWSM